MKRIYTFEEVLIIAKKECERAKEFFPKTFNDENNKYIALFGIKIFLLSMEQTSSFLSTIPYLTREGQGRRAFNLVLKEYESMKESFPKVFNNENQENIIGYAVKIFLFAVDYTEGLMDKGDPHKMPPFTSLN